MSRVHSSNNPLVRKGDESDTSSATGTEGDACSRRNPEEEQFAASRSEERWMKDVVCRVPYPAAKSTCR